MVKKSDQSSPWNAKHQPSLATPKTGGAVAQTIFSRAELCLGSDRLLSASSCRKTIASPLLQANKKPHTYSCCRASRVHEGRNGRNIPSRRLYQVSDTTNLCQQPLPPI